MLEATGNSKLQPEIGGASNHLLLAISQVDIAVLLTDISANITYVNPHFATLTGYSPEDMMGRSVEILRSDAHDPAFYRAVQERLVAGETWAGRVSLHTRCGKDYQARSVISAQKDDAGATIGYSAFFRDTTEELKLEAQLRQVQKMEAIGELASGIAHEINTPIQYIGDNIQFLGDALSDIERLIDAYEGVCKKARDSTLETSEIDVVAALRDEIDWDFLHEEIPQAIAQAMEGRNRVAEIVRAMKEFAHPGDETISPVDLNHAIQNTLAVSKSEWKYIAEVKTELADNMPMVPCFPGSFNQVLLNLVVNAAHAIGDAKEDGAQEKGVITLSTRIHDNHAEVRVQDSGCGISPEHRDRIFEPFYTTKDIGKGTGQGLALVHSVVVERMGGEVDLESTVGKGTTFILRLPLEKTHASGGEDR